MIFNRVDLRKNRRVETQFQTKYFMVSISTTLSSEISHARLFLLVTCGTLGRCSRNPGVPRNPG